jgi:hypothetical protein
VSLLRSALVLSFLLSLSPAALAQSADLAVELNKLEAVEDGCRAFFVVRNDGETAFESFDLDLVTFRPDGVVGARFQVELAPIAADKTVVKPFDFTQVDCGQIDQVLLNDVVACAPPDAAACLGMIEPTSLNADFFK